MMIRLQNNRIRTFDIIFSITNFLRIGFLQNTHTLVYLLKVKSSLIHSVVRNGHTHTANRHVCAVCNEFFS